MFAPTVAVFRVRREAAGESADVPGDLLGGSWSSSAIACGLGWGVASRRSGLDHHVLRAGPVRCGTAGCLECGGRVRERAVLGLGTVDARRFGMVRITSPEVLAPFWAGPELREWRSALAAFMRKACRQSEGGPFRAAAVVVEVEPSGTGRTLETCVCRALDADAYETAVRRWGGCAVCGGTGRSPMGHVHAHAVVAHDERVWYGTGEASPSFVGAWRDRGMLARMADSGLGSGRYSAIRGGCGGAAAYLRKVAGYCGKVADAGKERSEGERRWWALWSAWYLGSAFRRVSTHGEAFGRGRRWCAPGGDTLHVVGAPPEHVQRVPGPAPLLQYAYGAGRSPGLSLPPFIGERGALVERAAWCVSASGCPSMVPSLGQVASGDPRLVRYAHKPISGAFIATGDDQWFRCAVGDIGTWVRVGDSEASAFARVVALWQRPVHPDVKAWFYLQVVDLAEEVVRRCADGKFAGRLDDREWVGVASGT